MEKSAGNVEAQTSTKLSHFKLITSQSRVTPDILEHKYHGAGSDEDPYVVTWIENDPGNPMTFPTWKKWAITITVAIATLAVAFVSSAYSGSVKQIIMEFHCSEEVVTLGISLFVLGFAIGPLLWAPLSELYGRQVLYIGTYAMLTAFNAGAAGSQNIATLIILRFIAGSFGSSVLTNAGGVIADLFPASQRGLALSVFAVAPFLGPTIGPIVGGFLSMTKGWRWVEGLMAIFTGSLLIIGSLYVPETYAPVLLRKRAAALSKQTGKVYRTRQEIDAGPVSLGTAFKTALSRPWILLLREPIVLLLSIYMAIIYGTLYMCFGAFPIVFQENRGWNQGVGGLAFLGVAFGMVAAVIYTIPDNKRYNREAAKAGGFAPPEARLKPAMVGSIFIPIGLFWFAWTNYPSIHWFSAVAAGAPFGFGMVLVFLSIMNYLIDAYTIFAASVLAANSVLRSLFGAVFPLFTTQMYDNLGIHWASSVPAFLALACVPFPFLFYKYGPAIRARCKFAAESDAFMKRMRDEAAAGESEDEIEEEEEKEAEKDFGESPGPRAQRETSRFEKIKTGASVRSNRSMAVYEGNPYDIDRVNSNASGALTRSGTRGTSGLSRPTSRT